MKAVIMSGGFGTRLRPLTCNIPKADGTDDEQADDAAYRQPIEEARHHRYRLNAFLSAREHHTPFLATARRSESRCSTGKQRPTTAPPEACATQRTFLDERFIVISGDVLTDFDLSKAMAFHEKKKAKATLVLTRAKNPLQFGVVITNSDGKITRFLEKPSWGEVFSDTINTGIYILEPEVLQRVPFQQDFDFSKNLFPLLLEEDAGLFGYVSDGYWRDVGNLNEYQEAHLDALDGQVQMDFDGTKNGNCYIGEESTLLTSPDEMKGTVLIGKNCMIGAQVKIIRSVIGDGCTIEDGAVIRDSIIWAKSKIGRRAELSSCVLGIKSDIGEAARIDDNVFIGDMCVIGKESRLASNIRLWPGKVVEDGAILTRSLVWEDKWLRELFSDSRITGLSNIEMNPEFGAKLGTAFGAFVGKGKAVLTSRDSDNVSRMINRSIMCGLMSAGVDTNDLRATSIPILRHELRGEKYAGGIHVRKSPFDKNLTDIIFFDHNGKDLPSNKTKAVERLFFGEDFPRASYKSVGGISFPERAQESYIEKFLSTINTAAISQARFRLVIDYSNGIASTIFPNILGSLQCQAARAQRLSRPEKIDAR